MKLKIFGMLAALLLAGQANALTVGDSHYLGYVQFGIPSGDADRTAYVNHLIDMPLGSSDSALGQDFTRSSNDFGPLADAVFNSNGGTTTIDLGAGGVYSYLFAKYDGPNYGSEVWYVGDLSGIITIPTCLSTGDSECYGLSGWTLFGPGGTTDVPEPGTLALLGLGLAGLGLSRRRKA